MIITTEDGKSIDTETDLTAPERHILQKLFLWESMASGTEEFERKRQEALLKGWNNSGPVSEGPAMKSIVEELKKRVSARTGGGKS